jgi:DNA repair protein RecO
VKIPVYKTEGIVIGRFNAGEFDRFLIVYTKERGKIFVKAKSLRKKEAKMKGSLELFSHVYLTLAKGKNIDIVAGVTLASGFPGLRRDLLSLSTVYYICELLDKLIVGPEKDERIWDLVLKAFNFFEEKPRNGKTIKNLTSRFEYNLLSYLGHQPEKQENSYLNELQYICGCRIESTAFLTPLLR